MNWLDIIKIKPSKLAGKKAARDIRIVLVEAGFPLTYIGDINMSQWGPGEHSKILQINPSYLIEAANDFNEWLDNKIRLLSTPMGVGVAIVSFAAGILIGRFILSIM